jgi:hypothetical protein
MLGRKEGWHGGAWHYKGKHGGAVSVPGSGCRHGRSYGCRLSGQSDFLTECHSYPDAPIRLQNHLGLSGPATIRMNRVANGTALRKHAATLRRLGSLWH